jgi:drug/metabolite transporter (DMT)-like permease
MRNPSFYKKVPKKDLKLFAILGILFANVCQGLFNIGVMLTSAADGGISQPGIVVFTALISILLGRETANKYKLLGILLALMGTLCVAFGEIYFVNTDSNNTTNTTNSTNSTNSESNIVFEPVYFSKSSLSSALSSTYLSIGSSQYTSPFTSVSSPSSYLSTPYFSPSFLSTFSFTSPHRDATHIVTNSKDSSSNDYNSQYTGPFYRFIGICCFSLQCLGFSGYLIMLKPLLSKYDPFEINFFLFFFGIPGGILMGAYFGFQIEWSSLPPIWYLSILYTIIFASIFAFFLLNYATKYLSSTISSMGTCFQPLFSSILGWMILGETITFMHFIGGACLIMGMALVILSNKNDKKNQAYQEKLNRMEEENKKMERNRENIDRGEGNEENEKEKNHERQSEDSYGGDKGESGEIGESGEGGVRAQNGQNGEIGETGVRLETGEIRQIGELAEKGDKVELVSLITPLPPISDLNLSEILIETSKEIEQKIEHIQNE